MHYSTVQPDIIARYHQLTEELSAGCDSDFDTSYDDLEREFQELRLIAATSEGR